MVTCYRDVVVNGVAFKVRRVVTGGYLAEVELRKGYLVTVQIPEDTQWRISYCGRFLDSAKTGMRAMELCEFHSKLMDQETRLTAVS